MAAGTLPPKRLEITCILRCVVDGSKVTGKDKDGRDVWEKDPERIKKLAPQPPLMEYLTGTYVEVMHEATRLNAIQMRSKYLDYLYFPDPFAAKPVRPSDLK